MIVPVPDSFSEDEASGLASAAAARGISSAVAITTEPDIYAEQFLVQMVTDDVIEFDLGCHLRYFLLVPESGEFAVLHEANFYWLLAGPPDFVTDVLQQSPADAFDAFEREYASGDWPRNARTMFEELRRYRVLL